MGEAIIIVLVMLTQPDPEEINVPVLVQAKQQDTPEVTPVICTRYNGS